MLLLLIETIQRDAIISFPFLWELTLDPPAWFTLFRDIGSIFTAC